VQSKDICYTSDCCYLLVSIYGLVLM
jgi:hypothetical protein